jgi:hypothetical protein
MTEDILFGTYDRIIKWKKLKDDLDTKYRLLYLECRSNLELIKCFNTKSAKHNDPDLKDLIENLSIDIIELIHFESDKTTILEKLINEEMKIIKESDDSKIIISNPLTSAYLKIKTVKTLNNLNSKGSALKNINYKVRIQNIKTILQKIIFIIENNDDLKMLIINK